MNRQKRSQQKPFSNTSDVSVSSSQTSAKEPVKSAWPNQKIVQDQVNKPISNEQPTTTIQSVSSSQTSAKEPVKSAWPNLKIVQDQVNKPLSEPISNEQPTTAVQSVNDLKKEFNNKLTFVDLTSISAPSLKMCRRPDTGGIKGRQTQFMVNFFPIEIDYDKIVFQYQVDVDRCFKKKDGTSGTYSLKKDHEKIDIVKKVFSSNNLGHYIYDGDKILYHLKNDLDDKEFAITIENDHKEMQPFSLKLKLTSKIDLSMMSLYISNKTNEIPHTSIYFLDILYRQNKLESHVFEKRSLFDINRKGENLSDGLWYYPGCFQSVKACQLGWLQNVDLESCVFYKPVNLLDFIKEIHSNIDFCKPFAPDKLKSVDKHLRGLLVTPNHLDFSRKHKINKLVASANDHVFELRAADGSNDTPRQISVAKYFEETYKISLRYPNLPCVQVGDPKQPICFPIEVCNIVKGQRYMKKLNPVQQTQIAKGTVFSPDVRVKHLMKMINDNQHDTKLLNEFGIVTKSAKEQNKQMPQIKARILEPGNVYYKDFKPLRANDGKWRMMNRQDNKKFVRTENLDRWIIVWMAQDKRKSTEEFKKVQTKFLAELKNQFSLNGLNATKPPMLPPVLDSCSVKQIFEMIKKNMPNPQLVIIIIEDTDDNYAKIKSTADLDFGITTQCLKIDKILSIINDDRKLEGYLANVSLKINSKIGGTNNLVDFSNVKNINLSSRKGDPVMFLGADVTNFGIGSERQSIASLVGSRDLDFSQYCIKLSEQRNKNENRMSQEIILDIEEMAFLLIKSFEKNNKMLPKRLIFYRDGVDSTQFQKVLDFEIVALKNACKRLNFDPKITMIIAQKRHHTRFFPIHERDKAGRHGNIPAGSVIDTEITCNNLFDFYLCSHEAIQGTAKATHYVVIYDENNFSSDDIEHLTFDLCHLYSSSTKVVSLPSPVYYAHLAAYRGRLYESIDEEDESLIKDESFKSKLIEIHENLEEKMFFT